MSVCSHCRSSLKICTTHTHGNSIVAQSQHSRIRLTRHKQRPLDAVYGMCSLRCATQVSNFQGTQKKLTEKLQRFCHSESGKNLFDRNVFLRGPCLQLGLIKANWQAHFRRFLNESDGEKKFLQCLTKVNSRPFRANISSFTSTETLVTDTLHMLRAHTCASAFRICLWWLV